MLVIGAVIGGLFVALTLAVAIRSGPLPGEIAWIEAVQALGSPVPGIAEAVNVVTSTEAALVVGVVPAIVVIRRNWRRGALAVAFGAAAMLVVQPGVKEVVDRPRPAAESIEVRAESDSSSYPAGHSLSTTVVWGALALRAYRARSTALAVAAAVPIAATGLASGVLGLHWPSDSLAGTAVGGLAALAVDRALGLTDGGGPPRTPAGWPPWRR